MSATPSTNPRTGLAEVFKTFGAEYIDAHGLSAPQAKVFRAMLECRTAALGTIYELGEGVTEDDKEAFKSFSLAASQGYAKAQNNLGYMYDLGGGVAQDNIRAYKRKSLVLCES
jgi:TPR repeat protein